jgi:hypothetical protein
MTGGENAEKGPLFRTHIKIYSLPHKALLLLKRFS